MFGWQGELQQIAAQQAAMRRAIAQQRQQAALQAESLNRAYVAPQKPSLQQISGQPLPEPGAMPAEVLAQLDSTRGRWGQWLPTIYSEHERNHWWAEWLKVSAIGQEVAAERLQREIAQREAEAKAKELAEQRAMEARLRRELQERWRLPDGTVVRIKAPRSKFDGVLGQVASMYWRGEDLWAVVKVDPLPPGHPLLGRPERYRPIELLPTREEFAAEMLRREHPEALG